MKLCPVAVAVGCRKCPIFNVCPLKGVIGDQSPDDKAAAAASTRDAAPAKTAKAARPAAGKPANARAGTGKRSRRRSR